MAGAAACSRGGLGISHPFQSGNIYNTQSPKRKSNGRPKAPRGSSRWTDGQNNPGPRSGQITAEGRRAGWGRGLERRRDGGGSGDQGWERAGWSGRRRRRECGEVRRIQERGRGKGTLGPLHPRPARPPRLSGCARSFFPPPIPTSLFLALWHYLLRCLPLWPPSPTTHPNPSLLAIPLLSLILFLVCTVLLPARSLAHACTTTITHTHTRARSRARSLSLTPIESPTQELPVMGS